MEFLKTLGYFAINKALELWHNILLTLIIVVGLASLFMGALWFIGAIEIGLSAVLGFSRISLVLSTWCIYNSGIHGMCCINGLITFILITVITIIIVQRNDISYFIKSNWELAKSRKLYKHK